MMPRNQLSPFDKKLRKTISENLKKYTSHLTQGQLSDITGIPASTLSGYFSMRSTPNPGNIQLIADALHINKSDIDPRFSGNIHNEPTNSNNTLPDLTSKDEHHIQNKLKALLDDLDPAAGVAYYNDDEPLSNEDKELLRISLENTLRLTKQLAKQKFTPKKYRKE
jgi:transcriptional regulator with XRE-family HTH domain